MRSIAEVAAGTAVWDIATPSDPGRLPGIRMAGFRYRAPDPLDLTTVPFPAVTVVIDLGDDLVVEDTDGRRIRGSAVSGIGPGGVRGRGRRVECLQLRLAPAVAHAVFGPASELGGSVAPLDALWGADSRRIEERLRATTSWDDRFAIVEAELLRRGATGRTVDSEVAHGWHRIVAARGQVRVDELAADVGWSRKRLWSRFRSQVGLTPKRAAQLVRFDHAAHGLAAGHGAARVAAESGYADQSHLHREVVGFAGVTPTELAAEPWLAVDDVAWATPDPGPR